MALIMCSSKLWRQLGYAGRARSAVPQHVMPGVCLGSWAAKVFTDQGRDLVIALEMRTCLTLLFPFAPEAHFRSNLANALTHALHDAGVSPALVRVESAAAELAPIAFLRDPQSTDSLNRVQYICELEFCDHEDLRIIQRNLNDLPHPNRDPCVPIDAVRRVFHSAIASKPCLSH